MPDVTIHRCTLRIVRHGGWSWGAMPDKLLQTAIKILPELIARELGQYWTAEDDREIAAPVRVSIPIHLNELLALDDATSHAREFNYASEFTVVGQRINSAIHAALVDRRTKSEPATESEPPPPRLLEEVETNGPLLRRRSFRRLDQAVLQNLDNDPSSQLRVRFRPESFVVEVLRVWQRNGVLVQRLNIFSAAALESWHHFIVRTSERATVFAGERVDEIAAAVEACLRPMPLPAVATREAILRRRLIAIGEVLSQFELRSCPAALLSKLAEVIPLSSLETNHDQARSVVALDCDGKIDRQTVASNSDRLVAHDPAGLAAAEADSLERTICEQTAISVGLPPAKDPAGITAIANVSASLRAEGKVSESSAPSSVPPPAPVSLSDFKTPANQLPRLAGAEPNFSSRPAEDVISSNKAKSGPTQQPTGLSDSQAAASSHPALQRIATKLRREANALPFLLLGPLSRAGYLDTLCAVLEASENTAASPLFATALAYKLLTPPARGWRRDAATLSSAATFAALETPVPEPSLVQFAKTISPHLSPLDATLSGALIAGHNPNVPLLLLILPGQGIVLFDTEGVFPIQWVRALVDLRSTLVQLDSSVVFVPRASAGVEVLRWFSEQDFRFVTDAPPARGESLRSIRRPPDLRWWTNDEATPDSVFARMARSLPATVEDAFTWLQMLATDRPAIPLAHDAALDRHLTMTAAVALGTIAWDLWKEREQTAPHLALERFADLRARVDYTDHLVTVSLPLGKRFIDLREHGLLEDVKDVPWLFGRKLVFTSG